MTDLEQLISIIIEYEHPYDICWFYTNNETMEEYTECYRKHRELAKHIVAYLPLREDTV